MLSAVDVNTGKLAWQKILGNATTPNGLTCANPLPNLRFHKRIVEPAPENYMSFN